MSKVICDVCGTTYPETASVCPICGSAKNTTAQTAAGGTLRSGTGTSYVKGGRFSKRNVKKRNKAKAAETRPVRQERPSRPERTDRSPNPRRAANARRKNSSSVGLGILIVLLLIGIVVVMLYIGIKFFLPGTFDKGDPSGTTPSTSETTAPPAVRVPCESLKLSKLTIELKAKDDGELLSVVVSPVATTDKIEFASSDENVVTVDKNGMVTAVGGGEAVITVTCGDQVATCTVFCDFDPIQSTTTPPETTVPPVTVPDGFVLKLRYTEFSMSERWPDPVKVYRETNGVKATDITWTIDDPTVATVDENGVVTAVGRGYTYVRASIAGQSASCKVVVSYDPKPAEDPKYTISNKDVTLKVGETFFLTLTDERGVKMNVEWTANAEGFLTIDGSRITCKAASTSPITVSGVYEGVTYSCVVRFNTD